MRLRLLVVALAIPLLTGACVSADLDDGHVVFSGEYRLEEGQTLDGPLVVFSGEATAQSGSRIKGDVVITSGDVVLDGTVDGSVIMTSGVLDINGAVDGDLVAFSGDVALGPEAFIAGDAANLGGDIDRAPGSTVQGADGAVSLQPVIDIATPEISPWATLLMILGLSIMGGLIAILVTAVWLEYVNRTADAAMNAAVPSTAVGCLMWVLVVPALSAFAFTCCLLPVTVVGALLLVAAAVLGGSALGLEVGRRMGHAFDRAPSPVSAAGIGGFLLALVTLVITMIPCIGWILALLVSSLGLGAALLTRFGTRDYPARMPASIEPKISDRSGT
jgi:hypothetical protein